MPILGLIPRGDNTKSGPEKGISSKGMRTKDVFSLNLDGQGQLKVHVVAKFRTRERNSRACMLCCSNVTTKNTVLESLIFAIILQLEEHPCSISCHAHDLAI